MMKNLRTSALTAFFALLLSLGLLAQNTQKENDKKAILSMLGCYDVEFKYTETFAPEVDYEKAYDYTSAAFEWAELLEKSEDKIVIQHLLIINDSVVIKHWRQDWIYESNREFRYDANNRWIYQELSPNDSKGKWTQNVYQVDDSPRYSGTATWTHVDGTSSWYNKADSPLPRREYSKRDDYNVMKRGNRIQITPYGWMHEQDNDKIIRTKGQDDVLLAQEKGYNTYKQREADDCQQASTWWKKNQEMWTGVRSKWDDLLSDKSEVKIKKKVDNKMLYEHLFYSGKSFTNNQVSDLIDSYIESQSK